MRRPLRWAAFLAFAILGARVAAAAETLIVRVILNQQEKGELFVMMTADRDFLISSADWAGLQLEPQRPRVTTVEGQPYVSLRSIPGLQVSFNERRLELILVARPDLLPQHTVDMLPRRPAKVEFVRANSLFLNYDAHYLGTRSGSPRLEVTEEGGLRLGPALILSDGLFSRSREGSRYLRRTTELLVDNRAHLIRGTAGDFLAANPYVGSSMALGGLSVARNFQINPYLVRQPLFDLKAGLIGPSEVEVYLDGTRIATERAAPGDLVFRNIPGYGGARTLETVIKDASGRRQRLRRTIYFSDVLLRRGLSEFAYNVGFERTATGEGNTYKRPVVMAFHKYGVTNWLTLGGSVEVDRNVWAAGPHASLRLGSAGVVTGAFSASQAPLVGNGRAYSLSYEYVGGVLGTHVAMRSFDEAYRRLDLVKLDERVRNEWIAGLSLGSRALGSLNLQFTEETRWGGERQRFVTGSYGRTLARRLSIVAQMRRDQQQRRFDFAAGATLFIGRDTSALLRYQDERGTPVAMVQLLKNTPVGEGFGYTASFQQPTNGSPGMDATADLVYNGRYGTYSATARQQETVDARRDESYDVALSGGLAWVGGRLGLSRRIPDSFAVVQVPNIPHIRVYQNNQVIGRTDSRGRVFIPTLGSYQDNPVSIEDKDVPLEYRLETVMKYVSPAYRSGAVIRFPATRINFVTGHLRRRTKEGLKPVEFAQIEIRVKNRPVRFPLGQGGEFYAESVPPGRYAASVLDAESPCRFEFVVPATTEMVVDVRDHVCGETR